MPLRDLLFLIFLLTLVGGLVQAAWIIHVQQTGARFVERHVTVNARVLEGVIWFAIDARAWAAAPSLRLAVKAAGALTTSAVVAAVPLAALWAAGAEPVQDHGIAAGIAALAWASVLEAPSMPYHVQGLRSGSVASDRHIVFWIVTLVVLDLVAIALALWQPAWLSARTNSALIGVGFVAFADAVSVALALAFSAVPRYPLAP